MPEGQRGRPSFPHRQEPRPSLVRSEPIEPHPHLPRWELPQAERASAILAPSVVLRRQEPRPSLVRGGEMPAGQRGRCQSRIGRNLAPLSFVASLSNHAPFSPVGEMPEGQRGRPSVPHRQEPRPSLVRGEPVEPRPFSPRGGDARRAERAAALTPLFLLRSIATFPITPRGREGLP